MKYTNSTIKHMILLLCGDTTEMRSVTLDVGEHGGITLTERCDGEATMAAFGTISHMRRISLSPKDVRGMLRSLGAEGADAHSALRHYFAADGVFLSDLQDLLDTNGVSYACMVWNGSEAAYRAAVEQGQLALV